MKYFFLLIPFFLFSCDVEKNEISIIPEPVLLTSEKGFFRLDERTIIAGNDAALIGVFSEQVKEYTKVEKGSADESDIQIEFDQSLTGEAYYLQVAKKRIIVRAGSSNGAFYALQTLRQLIFFSELKNESHLIPCCTIEDAPVYSWRGIMLDESRHFFGAEKVKQMLDMMALHKLNIFHWHLTDCAGWRLEIQKYPKLTTTGGIGNHSNPEAPAVFYTQHQIKDIVKYAADRYITIIPEIDMPGHAASSNRAYPEFSGGGSASYPEFTFNPGLEGTYSYLTDILHEVTELFPSPFIHLGGDEVYFGNEKWNTDKQVKSLMNRNNLPDLKAVEKYFVIRMADSIKSLKKTTIGWDEIVDLKLNPEDAIVMWWRHNKPEQLDSALFKNYRVILCPRIPLYFDFVQDSSHTWGRRWDGAFSDLETVYNFPFDTLFKKEEHKKQVLGIQANLWTEVISKDKRLDFMTYPRLSALAEAAWTDGNSKNYEDFLERLRAMLKYLDQKNIYYFDPFEAGRTPEPEGPGK